MTLRYIMAVLLFLFYAVTIGFMVDGAIRDHIAKTSPADPCGCDCNEFVVCHCGGEAH